MCVCVCMPSLVCARVYLCSVAMHTFLAGRRGTDEQTSSEGGPAWRLFRVCVRLCAHERVRGNNKSLLYVLFWSTFGVRFVVSGGHNSDGLMAELLSQDAQHTNHCLPHRVTLHQTNPVTAPTTEKESNQCPHPNF